MGLEPAGRWLTACLAAAAVLVNCVLVQAHIDQPALIVAEAAGVAATGTPNGGSGGGSHTLACPVCQAAAAAGGLAFQPTFAVEAPRAFVLVAAAHADTSIAAVARSHAWRSRAPPSLA